MFVNNINPILFDFRIVEIRWYGLFLAIGTLASVCMLARLFKQKKYQIDLALDIALWLIIGGLIGARLGHILFYNLNYFLSNPKEIIMINHGGLSSHGLTIGLIITFYLLTKLKKIPWREYVDILVIPLPILIFFIRIGNFFNSEIVGRATGLPWSVKFPVFETNPVTRHPSQIYESLLGLLIFFVLFFVYKKYGSKLPRLFITNLFIFIYFSTRFLVEFTKEFQALSPDNILTTGQWLSIPFIIYSTIWFGHNLFFCKK